MILPRDHLPMNAALADLAIATLCVEQIIPDGNSSFRNPNYFFDKSLQSVVELRQRDPP